MTGEIAPGGDPEIDRPIFIIGTGRSGTTLFLNLLAYHPALAWFSGYSRRLPKRPQVALLSRVLGLPGAHLLVGRGWRWVPRPAESYEVLDAVSDGAFTGTRPLLPEDLTDEASHRFRRISRGYLRWQGRPRFLCKYTGLPRIGYVRRIFPDARFIHVYRDGRAVANSLLRVGWWSGDLSAWRYGRMRPEYLREYLEQDQEPVVLAGIAWKTLMAMIEEEAGSLPPEQYLRVRYDALIRDVAGTMDRVLRFCDLAPSPRFDRFLARQTVRDMDTKWRQQLSAREVALLEKCLGDELGRYGFDGGADPKPLAAPRSPDG